MLIYNNPTQFSNIGKRIQNFFGVNEYWNQRGKIFPNADAGAPSIGGGTKYMMRMKELGSYIHGLAIDSNRNWTTPYQDIIIRFNAKVQDGALTVGGTATGHTIKVNAVAQTTTYRSGSGTGEWVLRIPIAGDNNDSITYSYDGATGNTTVVDTGAEIETVTDKVVGNQLSKRVRFTLKKSDNSNAANETVKLGILRYESGVVGDFQSRWMEKEQWSTPTTDSDGVLDVEYTGPSATGDTVYIIIIRTNATPVESFVWTDTVK